MDLLTQHATRAEFQGTTRAFVALGALSLTQFLASGAMDWGNYLGAEMKGENKRTPIESAMNGIVITRGTTGAEASLGIELTTKELVDQRKLQHILMGTAAAAYTQGALATAATDGLAFSGGSPAVLNNFYQITKTGTRVRDLTGISVTVGGTALTNGVDYLVELKFGLIRFINPATLPAAAVVITVSAPAVDANSPLYMLGWTPLTQTKWSAYAEFMMLDQDPVNPLAIHYEPRPVEITVTKWPKMDHKNQSELTLMCAFTSNAERVIHRPA
jgi:hypothetical protein